MPLRSSHCRSDYPRGSYRERPKPVIRLFRSCLELAAAYYLKSIAFCCISTGEFQFPNEKAAEIAIQTIQDYQKENQNSLEVVFNVFKDSDYKIYKQLLG